MLPWQNYWFSENSSIYFHSVNNILFKFNLINDVQNSPSKLSIRNVTVHLKFITKTNGKWIGFANMQIAKFYMPILTIENQFFLARKRFVGWVSVKKRKKRTADRSGFWVQRKKKSFHGHAKKIARMTKNWSRIESKVEMKMDSGCLYIQRTLEHRWLLLSIYLLMFGVLCARVSLYASDFEICPILYAFIDDLTR